MKPYEERAKEAQERIVPILKELFVDLGSAPFITEQGTLRSKLVWVDAAPKEESAIVTPEAPKIVTE